MKRGDCMESCIINRVDFVFKERKIQIDKVYMKFYQVEDERLKGLFKTPFKVYLDGKFLGNVSMDMFAITPELSKDGIHRTQVIVKTCMPDNFSHLTFSKDMKLRKFVGKIFKQDHMIENDITKNYVILYKDNSIRRRKKHNGRRAKKLSRKQSLLQNKKETL